MIKKVLIANRGEIAIRIIRACRELGIKTVAVFSQADREALHAQLADESICIGPANSSESYLNIHAILAACELTGVDAIHPGFGFLSENIAFAQACEKCGIIFVGPNHQSIAQMGDKARAKKTMIAAGVPVVPGSEGIVNSEKEALQVARTVGYPVLVKATAGGGGRGIRLVESEDQLLDSMNSAQVEAKASFGNGDVYIEKFIEKPRHVEIQILGDQHGNVVHLGERDCSIQRRNQKMIEEAPCPIMTDALRKKMGEAAKTAARACGYYNAGTIEFLVDKNLDFYFMEMNTRIQVEHGITELVTGIDLVKQQLLIASGEKLPFKQQDILLQGHSIECRINAENPHLNFRPSPGKIEGILMPGGPGVRLDSAIYCGYTIPPNYDSMIAKLMVHAPTRKEAIIKMRSALVEFAIEGIDNNIDYQLNILKDPDFEKADYDIGFLSREDKNFLND